jgi:tetratricopeptide (TPR) repeat protein
LKKRSCIFLFAVLLLLLAGCASVPTQPSDSPPSFDTVVPDVIQQPSGDGAVVVPAPVPKPVMSRNQAVLALLDRSQIDIQAGERESAGASLERALRIEPRNAWLWQELAQLRLTQGQYAQAISLARKSISFAGKDKRLLVLDWRVIGNARVALGTPTEAEQAFKFAADFEQAAKLDANLGF